MKTTLSPRRRKQVAAYQAQPVALIERPLRFVMARNMLVVTDAKGNQQHLPNATYRRARIAAQRGLGRIVRAMARAELAR